MVKAIYFLKRKPGMDLDEFFTYWRTKHADAVRKVPELRRYIQCHTIRSGYSKGEPVWDGAAELWYDDTATMRRIATTPESRAAAADDDAFLDMSRFEFILTEEVVQKEGAVTPSMVHLVEFVNRKPGMDVAGFHRYWREHHGPLAIGLPMMRRYVQSHVRESAYSGGREPRYDGVAEVWFDSTDAMRESAKGELYAKVREDEPNFIDTARLSFIITHDHQIV